MKRNKKSCGDGKWELGGSNYDITKMSETDKAMYSSDRFKGDPEGWTPKKTYKVMVPARAGW